MTQPDRTKINADFERLQAALKDNPLPTEGWKTRQGEASEFMWMQETGGRVHFKHRDSRNYLMLLKDGSLFIPQTKEPFLRGTFETFEPQPQIG